MSCVSGFSDVCMDGVNERIENCGKVNDNEIFRGVKGIEITMPYICR